MSTPQRKTAVIIGVGPGLGMSIAHRFGREGYAVALISRTSSRHASYLSSLASVGIAAESFAADVNNRDQILPALDQINERFGSIDVLYYGPGAIDPNFQMKSITEVSSSEVQQAMTGVYPAIDVVGRILPDMIKRGDGGLLFAGGLSAIRPMPALGALTILSAAFRNYVLTLNAGLADTGVYAGILTIGGLVERGDIYNFAKSQPQQFGELPTKTLSPEDIADAAWQLYVKRDRAEAVFSVFS